MPRQEDCHPVNFVAHTRVDVFEIVVATVFATGEDFGGKIGQALDGVDVIGLFLNAKLPPFASDADGFAASCCLVSGGR